MWTKPPAIVVPGFVGVSEMTKREREYVEAFIPKRPCAVLEIGTFDGVTASLFAKHRPKAHITSVDPFTSRNGRSGACHLFCWYLNKRDNQSLIVGASSLLHREPHCRLRFEVVVIDGDHSEKGVMEDLRLATKILRQHAEARILCHDYIEDPEIEPDLAGVRRAVRGFCSAEGWGIEGKVESMACLRRLF
jgi:predicted O-methyltransferase YrrM